MNAQFSYVDEYMPDSAAAQSGLDRGSHPALSARELPSLTPEPVTPATAPAAAQPISTQSFTAALLTERRPIHWRAEASRFAIGLGLAALYGIALGIRHGGTAIVRHAIGVPAALVAVAGLGVPALTIVLTLFDAPLDPPRAMAASSRAAASSGLVLGGLAPATALFVITSEAQSTAAGLSVLGLFAGGAIGLKYLLSDLRAAMVGSKGLTKTATNAAFLGFAVFAVALAIRVWWTTLPLLQGGAS
jgi:hypothetical protein